MLRHVNDSFASLVPTSVQPAKILTSLLYLTSFLLFLFSLDLVYSFISGLAASLNHLLQSNTPVCDTKIHSGENRHSRNHLEARVVINHKAIEPVPATPALDVEMFSYGR